MSHSAVFSARRDDPMSNLPDVILHIGSPKSGSSAIQRFCIENRPALFDLGYYYPEHSLDVNHVSGGHSLMGVSLIKGNPDKAFKIFTVWLKEAQLHGRCLLLSAESFYIQHRAMREICKGLQVKIIAFVRNPVEFLLAKHNQSIKRSMGTLKLNEQFRHELSRSSGRLFGEPLLAWADAFGEQHCIFRPYQKPEAGAEPVERQFLQALGLSSEAVLTLTVALPGMTNRSYIKPALELKRLINTVLPALPTAMAQDLDHFLQRFSDLSSEQQGYTVNDLPEYLISQFEQETADKMQPVIERFPQLVDLAGPLNWKPENEPEQAGINLSEPLKQLTAELPDVADAIYQQALKERDQGRSDYTFFQLLEVLMIDFSAPDKPQSVVLTAQQRNILAADKLQVAECLREMAIILEQQGALQDALFVISRALERRPNGPVIQKIKQRIESKLSAT